MEILEKLSECIEYGKSNKEFKHPPHLVGSDGASELTAIALSQGISPDDILKKGLMTGMNRIGEKFSTGKAFIPNLLISAKAMYAAMEHLKPFFESGEAKHKGTMLIGTVAGDLHDIGKNIVKMVMEGDGWKVIDLGVNVKTELFLENLNKTENCIVGLSALLTTTMLNMEETVREIKKFNESIKVFVGGAPLSEEFALKIGADKYFADPHSLTKYFN
jgi:methanogenic corrinoid protein MtbC1